MKNIIFIACLALVSCQYENETPSPVEYSQPEYRNVSQIDSVFKTLKISSSSQTGVSIGVFSYTATSTVNANIKVHLWASNPSYGFQFYVTKNGKTIGNNMVGNHKDFNGVREIVILDVPLVAGDQIQTYIGHSSAGATTIYPTGTHLGFPNDSSYFLLETF
jgi:hypothetical protein